MHLLRPRAFLPVGGRLLAALLAGVVLTACRNETSSDLVRSALDYQAKGDHKAAIIQLKNAVQKQPDNGEARLLLGKSSLAVGDVATAEKEFRKAAEFGQPANVVAPLLAQALLDSSEPELVVSEFGRQHLSEPAAEASLRVIVGQAQVRLGKIDDATASFKSALAADPSNVPAQLAQAQLAIMEGKTDAAIAMVDQVVAKNPNSAEALLLQGDLRLLRGDRTGGREALERAVAADPGKAPARLELIAMLIAEREFDAATAQIATARSVRAGDLRLVYFEALIAAQQKDFTKARELTQQLLKRAPDHVPTLVLAGAVEMQDKKPVAAEAYLQKAVTLAPQHDGARKMLVRSYMASNQPALALEAAKPLEIKGAQLDAPTLMLVGEAYLANGNVRQASSLYAAAAESKPHETAARVRLGQIAMVSGDPDRGIRELEAATALEGAPAQADLELIAGYLRRGETAKALEAAKALVKKRPDDPMAYQILGTVNLGRKDAAAARAAYGKALELNPTYLPAVSGLARLDFAENRPSDARARFEAVVAKEPNIELALLGLAEVLAAMKTPAPEIVQVLQRAIAAKPQSAAARVALVNLYLQEKDTRAALLSAQEASAALRDDVRVLDALGRAQAAAGETNQAIETFNRLAAAQPQSALPLLRLASIYGGRNEVDKAIETLLRAQKVAPSNTDIGRDLVRGYLAMGKGDDALKQAKALQVAAPASAVGHILEGDVYGATRQWGEAERAYRAGLKVDPESEEGALRLHGVLMAAGKKSEADAAARKWLSDHPNDVIYRSYLAEQALRTRDLKAAVAQYQTVIAQQPNNVAALNNLAWAAGQLGDPKAMAYAERALKLAPNNAAVLDTAGVLLVSAGDTAKGLEYLTRAVSIAPERMDIRFNFAKALIKAGRTEDARRELTQLQSAAGDFTGKSEVPALLKQLK